MATGNFLYLGTSPGYPTYRNYETQRDLEEIESLHCDTIIVLSTPQELKKAYPFFDLLELYSLMEVEVLHFPTPDYDVTEDIKSFNILVSRLAKDLNELKDVFVHCGAGLGRTGTLIAALLISKGHSVHQALEKIRSLRPGSVETREQVLFLVEYFDFIQREKRNGIINKK
jgi:protein-tyrosine phosphatase